MRRRAVYSKRSRLVSVSRLGQVLGERLQVRVCVSGSLAASLADELRCMAQPAWLCSGGIRKAFSEIPSVLPYLLFPNKPFLSTDTVKTTLRDSVIVACTIVAMVFAARLWDLLVATLLSYGMSALVGRPPL